MTNPGLAELLRAKRLRARLTVIELAREVGVAERTIRYLEAGETLPTLEVAARLCAVLRIAPARLLRSARLL